MIGCDWSSDVCSSDLRTRAPDSWTHHHHCRVCSQSVFSRLPFWLAEIPTVEERLNSCSAGIAVLGGTGNKYDAGRCGISDGTLGNASKMSRSNGVSALDDGEMEVMDRSEPGVSGMMGGSMGSRSGIASSWCSMADQLSCNRTTMRLAHQGRPTWISSSLPY